MHKEMVLILAAIAFALADTRASTNITAPRENNMNRILFFPLTIEERGKQSLIPKSALKFIVTQRPYTKKVNSTLGMKYFTSLTKTGIQTSTESEIAGGLKETRAPLLKARKFSPSTQAPIQITTQVNFRTPIASYAMLEDETSKQDSVERSANKKTRQNSRYRIRRPTPKPYVNSGQDLVKEMKNTYRSKESTEDFVAEPSQTDVIVVKNTADDHTLNTKIEDNANKEQIHISKDTVESSENAKDFSDINDKKDLKNMFDDLIDEEYLVVRDKKNQAEAVVASLLSDTEEDTTAYVEEMEQPHDKTKRNVVEEDNLTSTVSGFKFTGKDTNLHSHLSYKNINS